MYLKRLDLQGFKSFPEKVKLEFNKGITSVVGPNGSGKSNISDSVRWVLGEQRAKSLRGDKMEDVIFAGTSNRKPLGFAEVSITIDNTDHKMPIDYTEVKITRRVFRSGESEYLINGTNCRLKDVHELFMDTGVGREGYSIIGQGRIDEILSSKSEDRRRLFEEAAGIVKYKNRRMETVSKLEREQQNLVRVKDIINELEVQLEPLETQAEIAKKYMSIKEKLKAIDVNLFQIQSDKIDGELEEIEGKHKILSDNAKSEISVQNNIKEKTTSLKEQNDALTEEIQNINNEIIEIRTEIEKNEGYISVTEEQMEHFRLNIARIKSEIESKKAQIETGNKETELFKTRYTAAEVSLRVLEEKLAQKETEFSNLNKTLSESEIHIDEYKSDMIEKIKITTDIKGSLQRTQGVLEQFDSRKEQLANEKAYIVSQIEDNKVHISAAQKKIENNLAQEKLIKEKSQSLLEQKQGLKQIIEGTQQKLQIKTRQLNEKQSRFKILSEMEKEHEGFFKSVKNILKLKESGNPKWKGIHGAVGELLFVDEGLETAIEIALGGSMQNIVTSTEEDAKNAISYLKSNNLGRATFLPISAVRPKDIGSDKTTILSEKGIMGVGKDLVKFDKKYENVISSLLGKVIIADTIENAIQFSKKYRYSYKVVTLEGDVLNPGGAMTGGSTSKKTTNVFGRSREIGELKESLEVISKEFEALKCKIEELTQNLEKCAVEISQNQLKTQEIRMNIASAQEDVNRTKSVFKHHEEKLNLYVIEENQLDEQREEAFKNIGVYQSQIAKIDGEIAEIDKKLSLYQNTIENEKSEKDDILNRITDLKINISNVKQEQGSFGENINRIKVAVKSLEDEVVKLEAEIKSTEENIKLKLADIEKYRLVIAQKKETQNSKQINLGELTDKRKDIANVISSYEGDVEIRMNTIAQLKNDIFRIETKKEKLLEEKQRIYDNMWEEYELTYQMAKQYDRLDISYAELQRSEKQLKGDIRALGHVNVNAITEYKEKKERYEFLLAQKEDIIKAEDQLKDIIAELSRLMEEQFKTQFELISENFNTVFMEMFGGGKAYLKLTDSDNALESAIEIIAQPPGKNLQNMMLLSGGERALTAIAILFSILKMKPSPFCILDEIEAALDDANVKRFADYLKRFSGDTQFIVITHRKGTMEAADVMYGVTMQEMGVSKLVSVKFADVAV